MNKLFNFLISLLIIPALAACYYDSEEELYPGTIACDTSNITFSQTIQPILSQNCNSCHNPAISNGGVITDNYQQLITHVNSGIFWKAINHEPGAVPMPFGGQKLPDCDLAKIKKWIDNGAPNN